MNKKTGSEITSLKGFTLIEAIITIVLVFIIGYILADAITKGIKAYLVTDQRKEALDYARIPMERITREIRTLRSADDVGTSGANNFCYVNILGEVGKVGEVVSFRYDTASSSLERDDTVGAIANCPGTGGSTLATNITDFSFSYIQNAGASEPTFTSDTRRVRINLTSTVSGESLEQESEIHLRNIND